MTTNSSLWLTLAMTAALAGCSSLANINVVDSHASKVAARVVVRPEGFPKTTRSQGGLEFGYEHYRGANEQTLEADSASAKLNGKELPAPDHFHNRVRINQVYGGYNHVFNFRRFQLEPRAGLAYQQVDFRVSSSNPAIGSINVRRSGLYGDVGVTPRFNFSDVLAAEARVSAAVGPNRRSLDGELALVFRPVPALSLRAGYFWRDQQLLDANASDLSLRISGPTASVVMNF